MCNRKNEASYIRRLTSLFSYIKTNRRIQGYCYTQFTDVMQETNGLLSIRREPKIAIDVIRAILFRNRRFGTHFSRSVIVNVFHRLRTPSTATPSTARGAVPSLKEGRSGGFDGQGLRPCRRLHIGALRSPLSPFARLLEASYTTIIEQILHKTRTRNARLIS